MTPDWRKPVWRSELSRLLACPALAPPFRPPWLIVDLPASRGNFIGSTTSMRLCSHNRKPVASPSPRWRRWMHGIRQVVESLSGKLHLAFRLAIDRLPTVPGFRARLAAKVGLHNFCCWLNLQRGRPALAFADLVDF